MARKLIPAATILSIGGRKSSILNAGPPRACLALPQELPSHTTAGPEQAGSDSNGVFERVGEGEGGVHGGPLARRWGLLLMCSLADTRALEVQRDVNGAPGAIWYHLLLAFIII